MSATAEGLRVHLLGVRGSTPVSGSRFAGVGGRTSCVAVEPSPGPGGRWLVLDAGTGFTSMADLLHGDALDADVVLTHLHWDHLQGLPFLANADRADACVDLWIPARPSSPGLDALERLSQGFGPPFFPIRPDELRGRWRFHADAGVLAVADTATRVVTGPVRHKGGPTVGVRVERGASALAYLPDHCIGRAGPDELERARDLCRGVDVLLHDAQHRASERQVADDFGHCTVVDAVDLAVAAGVGRLVLVHHGPGRSDAAVADLFAEATAHAAALDTGLRVELGREGDVVRL